jgi:hypothetical protein
LPVHGFVQAPQVPPHPSGPQAFPSQAGQQGSVQAPPTHSVLSGLPVQGSVQAPQAPPQPSSPQVWPSHAGTHPSTQAPAWQVVPGPQVPHSPPHPSGPQAFPSQAGWHDDPQPPQSFWHSPTQVPSHSPSQQNESSWQTHASHLAPGAPPVNLGVQPLPPWHRPLSQVWSASQAPQLPPHPSSPQALAAQSGLQAGVVTTSPGWTRSVPFPTASSAWMLNA